MTVSTYHDEHGVPCTGEQMAQAADRLAAAAAAEPEFDRRVVAMHRWHLFQSELDALRAAAPEGTRAAEVVPPARELLGAPPDSRLADRAMTLALFCLAAFLLLNAMPLIALPPFSAEVWQVIFIYPLVLITGVISAVAGHRSLARSERNRERAISALWLSYACMILPVLSAGYVFLFTDWLGSF